MKLTPGKRKGLEAVSDSRGVIAAAAMDQRGSLKSAIAKDKGIDKKAVTNEMMAEFKEAVVRVLTPHASAILLDPEYGLSAAKQRAKNAGLLLAYENSGYDNTQPGRLPDLLDHYSVRRLVADGADCIKILLYYTPFDSAEINDVKHAWVERIGAECVAADVPFFLEFVGYEEGVDEKGLEFAKKKPEVVTRSMEEFSKPQYAVDVLKVEVPVTMAFVKGTRSCKGDFGLHARRSQGTFPQGCRGRQEAVHLSLGRREQRHVHRNARSGLGNRRQFFRRAVRPRHVERCDAGLRQARRQGAGRLAERSGREKHQERQRPADGRQAVVFLLRRHFGFGAGVARAVARAALPVRFCILRIDSLM